MKYLVIVENGPNNFSAYDLPLWVRRVAGWYAYGSGDSANNRSGTGSPAGSSMRRRSR